MKENILPSRFSTKFASWFSNTCLNGVKHPIYGSHQVLPLQIGSSPVEYKRALWREMTNALKRKSENKNLWKKLKELNITK